MFVQYGSETERIRLGMLDLDGRCLIYKILLKLCEDNVLCGIFEGVSDVRMEDSGLKKGIHAASHAYFIF